LKAKGLGHGEEQRDFIRLNKIADVMPVIDLTKIGAAADGVVSIALKNPAARRCG
jgi:hypothetical protein